jgi:hypothetical protein
MNRQDAADLAQELVKARTERPDDFWEIAAERAGVPTRLLRIISHDPDRAFLLDEAWVIQLDGTDSSVREWSGHSDPLYSSAEELGAFEDLS